MNLIRNWKRIMAIGCTHGELQDDALIGQVLAFRAAFKPDIRVHLGDLIDTAAFRSGAGGTRDECRPIAPDRDAALNLLEAYEPTHITWGNHDHRLWELSDHPKAIVAEAASALRKDLEDTARSVGAKTYPYHYRKNVALICGVHYMHGISYAVNALKIHSDYVCGRAVFAHTHRNGIYCPNGLSDRSSFNVGTLANIEKLTYAHQKLATGSWGPGLVFGYGCEEKSYLWLVHADQGQPLIFPMEVM